ncbi:MAG: DUF1292 domain-containing protein [Marvinbryantia sp.]|uniref:DUF1292 domain-containing protein n=1 Tax=Marvinbryantia sp. TaxID=2496532 RepID=UPI0025F663E4|nr:DUF1292 domain-containing protein [uncultured Marvinbryantia sp.]
MSENDVNCSGNCASCGEDCEQATVTLTLDNGEILECAILTVYPVGDKQYIALLPLDENGENEDGEVFLYRYKEENGNPSLENIEDDDEYEAAADAFDEMLDEQEFDELLEDDEEE